MTGGGFGSAEGRPPVYKAVGIALAISSGVFIGVSFVLKKKGLLAANIKEGKEAGEGYGYLKNFWWWSGMILMILGELCNFAAYAFVDAILVTPLGALSVVITAILSSIFLKERLSFVGKVGCFMCIVGSVVIAINAPSQSSVKTIQDMKGFVIHPGFLSYAGVVIVACAGIVIWVAPKYGNKSMMVYITVCSLIGGLSVVATQGLGAAIVSQASGIPQFNQWFLYVLLVFVVVTLLVEIVYLNKALNIFNAALVTPTYYVYFTSATIITSAILFRGFKGTGTQITTIVLAFFQICAGVVLLQLSKSAKDVPDTEIFKGELDQVKLVAEQSEPESEPKADTIRGTAAIIRQISVARRNREVEEAWRVHGERVHEMQHPDEQAQWDGVRRRVTYSGDNSFAARRRNTLSSQPRFPVPAPIVEDNSDENTGNRRRSMSVDEAMRRKVYPDLENQLMQPVPEPRGHDDDDDDTFLNRVRNLFVTKQRSKASLLDPNADTAYSAHPHRDQRDSATPTTAGSPTIPNRPRGNTTASFPDHFYSEKFEPYTHHSAAASSPHVHFSSSLAKETLLSPTESPTGTHSRDWAIPHSSGGAYESIPSGDRSGISSSLKVQPGYGSAKRQFSFQTLLHPLPKGRSSEMDLADHHATSEEVYERPTSRGNGHGLHVNLRPWKKSEASQTEEEMLGLVKGDRGRDDQQRGGGGIRMVSTGESEAGLEQGNSGGNGRGRER